MPERYEDLLYILKCRKAFKASGIVTFSDNLIALQIRVGPEAKSINFSEEIVSDVLLNNALGDSFYAKEAVSNKDINIPIPPNELSEGIAININ